MTSLAVPPPEPVPPPDPVTEPAAVPTPVPACACVSVPVSEPERTGRDDPQSRDNGRPCTHPGTQKIDGKTCCAQCGVQLYL